MLARAAFPAFFLVLGGFIMFLLVTLSVPIIKTIYLLKIEYPGGSTAANIGVLGTCFKGGNAEFLGFDYSGTAYCTDPKVGYRIDPSLLGYDGSRNTSSIIVRALSGSLIINALAAGFAGFSLFFAFFAWLCASRVMEIILFITMFFTAFVAWIAWALDCALTLVARRRVDNYTSGTFSGHIGNAFWLALAGAFALSFGLCFAGCGMFGRYSRPRENYVGNNVAPSGAPAMAEKPAGRRRWPWQRNTAYRGTY
ncbi:hypothetical protein BD324DRAFT_83649 [Kockovaella imperatae]|uniref:SUR7/PalI family-domain-containing protein n=1 Tax=Kockovaella imperatae TaxID=4999 RepID=A0A1Y1UCJ1_9TREE|nr:hypothetical protein BD324DRAFT_83649 [Kockovaella imperatae]ORX35234.1 hypothetical protein BD324DRAFT_83649 [Kockovaella imperatae]